MEVDIEQTNDEQILPKNITHYSIDIFYKYSYKFKKYIIIIKFILI